MLIFQLQTVDENKGLKLIDAPVSGGVIRASEGTLTVRKLLLLLKGSYLYSQNELVVMGAYII